MSVLDLMNEISKDAALSGRPKPVIYTDMHTALHIAKVIGREIGLTTSVSRPTKDYIAMYDGIMICSTHQMKKDEVSSEWRDYFGPLADIIQGGMPLAKD